MRKKLKKIPAFLMIYLIVIIGLAIWYFFVSNRKQLETRQTETVKLKIVASLIKALDNNTILEDEHIGFVGEPSTTYQLFQQLARNASDTTLVQLAYHRNPKMRVYGMWGLIQRDRRLATLLFVRIKYDSEHVTYYSGCTICSLPVCKLVEGRLLTSEMKFAASSY